LTAEQLQAVRAERWRQKSNPVLTLDDAAAWINNAGLCLFLPRRHQFPAPAPSFVEATIGIPSETPAPAAIETARSLMIRLVESGSALPLNLFGAPSEQPDFLASREAFPYIFSLRGGRNWKTPPPKATPLVTEIWKALEPGASLEATEIQAAIGREITETAILRGLVDLWSGQRVMPVYDAGGPTRWELTQKRFSESLTEANKIAQTTALSVLVSLYLESVLAATPEEIETFLSPLTSRSKVREVVNGLSATRQLALVPVATQTMYCVAGSLPEFAEPEQPESIPPETQDRPPRFDRQRPPREGGSEGRRPSFERKDLPRTGPPRPERFAAGGGDRPRRKPFGDRPPREGGSEGRRPSFERKDRPRTGPPRPERLAAGGGDRPRRKPFGDRPPYRKSETGQRPGNYPRRKEGAGHEGKAFPKRPYEQRSFDRPRSDKPARPFETGRANDSPSRGGKFPPKKFGEGGSKFPPKKFGGSKFGSGKFTSGKPRSGEKRPFFRDKPGKPAGDRPDRGGMGDRPSSKRSSAPPQRGWKPKPSGFSKSAKPGFGKPKFGGSKFGPPKPGGSKFSSPRPGGAKFGSPKPGGSKFGSKKFGGPSSRGQFRGKFGGAKPGFKSGPKPGGMKPPFRKRKDERKDQGNQSSE
jgi:23S rRNA pseudouridine2605 synthase